MHLPANRSTRFAFQPDAARLRWRHAFALAAGLAFAAGAVAHEHQHEPPVAPVVPASDVIEVSATVITAVQQSSPLTIVTDPKQARQPVPPATAPTT